MATKKQKNVKLVPKLRFPEFKKNGEWSEVPLSNYTQRIRSKVGSKILPPVSITAGKGFVEQSKKFGRDISGEQYKSYIHIKKGDFVYNKGNSKTFAQGCVYQLKEFDEAAASTAFICFKLENQHVDEYFQNLFEHNVHGRKLTKFITSGARSNGLLNINATDFFSIALPFPPEKDEQQKIADCLGSLDKLIAAHSSKLDALQDHKKGLLQKLFPAEGKTTPELRFPEFQNLADWEVKKIPQISKNLNNKRVPITAGDRIKGQTPYYGASGVVDHVKGHLFDEELMCVSEDGANLIARTYPIAFTITGKTWVNNHAHVLKFEEASTRVYVEAFLNSIDLGDFITGAAQPKLNRGNLDSIPIPIAEPSELQKIAGSLQTLDSLINSQTKKLSDLNEHKKGLMQQLFPSTEEVSS